MSQINLLMVGDVFGNVGRKIFLNKIKDIITDYNISFVIVNGENSAGGVGITPKIANKFFESGVDVITSGNHIWRHREVYNYLNGKEELIRPANYPNEVPGKGYVIKEVKGFKIAVINLLGRVFINETECPFRKFDEIYAKIKSQTNNIVVDFHGEATSEKIAFAYYTSKRASAVLGTHTHVQTNDCRIYENHTAYISDVGMTGCYDNCVIGVEKDIILKKFLTCLPMKFKPAKSEKAQLNSVIVNLDLKTGKALDIKHLNFVEKVY